MTYNQLKTRFKELFNRRGRGSIKARDILTLIMELIDKMMGIDVSATATIRKSYDTLMQANADLNPIDPETNRPMKVGQLISVTTDPDINNNAVYRMASLAHTGEPTWERQAALGDMSTYAKSGGSEKTLMDVENDSLTYNMDFHHPKVKGYHSIDESIMMIKDVDRKLGMELSFLTGAGDSETWKYSGTTTNDASFLEKGFWRRIVDDKTLFKYNNYYSHKGFYVDKATGVLIENYRYKSTDYLLIDGDIKIVINTTESARSTPCAFYDEDFNFISSIDTETFSLKKRIFEITEKGGNGEFIIPTNAVYIRSTCSVNYTGGILSGLSNLNIIDITKDLIPVGNLFSTKAYIDKDSGAAVNNDNYKCTNFLPIDGETDIQLRCSGSGTSAAAYAFYDEKRNPLQIYFPNGEQIIEKVIKSSDIPAGARYIRCNSRPIRLKNPYVKAITVSSLANFVNNYKEPNMTKTLKVLNIGSSHGMDMIQSFPILCRKSGIDIKCANLYKGGVSLEEVASKCKDNSDFQRYSVNKDGSGWVATTTGDGTRTIMTALTEDDWDIIILQRGAYESDTFTTKQKKALLEIIEFITHNVSYNPHIMFSMGHSTAVGNDVTPTVEAQIERTNNIIKTAKQIERETGLKIIPTGTAIQNARNTFLSKYGTGENKDIARDLTHLDIGIGTYITGCTLFEFIIGDMFGVSVRTNSYIPLLSDISGLYGNSTMYTRATHEMAKVARLSAILAVRHPYELSHSLALDFPKL